MGLPSIIIAIILSALLIGIGTTYFGDVYSDGAADATAATLANQGQQISQSLDTLAANEGGLPAASEISIDGSTTHVLTTDGYLDQAPNPGIDGASWSLTEDADFGLVADVSGVSEGACESALESSGYDVEANGIPASGGTPAKTDVSDLMSGCYGDGSGNYTYFYQ